MNSFSPNLRVVEPAHRPEQLAEAVVGALSREMAPRLTWGPLKTIVLGLLTGGLLPLALLPWRFQQFISAERNHLWHFAEWLRVQFPAEPETERLHAAATAGLRFRRWVWILSLALAALAVVWAWNDLADLAKEPVYLYGPFGWIQSEPSVRVNVKFLFNFTARLPHLVKQFATVPQVMLTAAGCAMLLIAAHVMSLWQVVAHVRDVRAFVERFNAFATKHDLELVTEPHPKLGLNWPWIVGVVGLLVLGAWWGVPMMLAAAAQARYIRKDGRTLRLALAARAQALLARRRPMIRVPAPAGLNRRCPRPTCLAEIAPGADFCPRCGERSRA